MGNKPYIIPYNFAQEGYVYGKIKWINLVEAGVILIVVGTIIFKFVPLGAKGKMYIALIILIPLGVLAIKGVNELCLTSFLQDLIETKRDKGIYTQPESTDKIRREKILLKKKHKRMKQEKRAERKRIRKDKKQHFREHFRQKRGE